MTQCVLHHLGGLTSGHIIRSKDMSALKEECGDFSSLLLPREELEFSGIIGEGTYDSNVNLVTEKKCIFES